MKKITIDNYFDIMQHVDVSALPSDYREGHQLIVDATQNGQTWEAYHASQEIANIFDAFFVKLSEHLDNKPSKGKSRDSERKSPASKKTASSGAKSRTKVRATRVRPQKAAKSFKKPQIAYHNQERIPDEIKFMRRFLNLDGKVHSDDKLLRFINALQKAMVEKRIRKTSPNAEHMLYIQDALLGVYNGMTVPTRIDIRPEIAERFKDIVGVERIYPSVQYIKRFIGLHGKPVAKDKAARLLKNIDWAVQREIITTSDPYWDEIGDIKKRLASFTAKGSKAKTMQVEKAELNGLNGIVRSCGCQSLNGFGISGEDEDEEGAPGLMNSLDFAEMEFDTIGFHGKWLDLIGDPAPGFTAMVFGKPKMGKSYLCVEFAGYLARNHGKVLYVAREEGLDATLQQKLRHKSVAHRNLDVSDHIPDDLGGYDFVFLDSVNKLGLEPEHLEVLQAENPETSFIFIFQTTKLGNFRGRNTFQHDVDVVIEIPEKGRAVQFGRFNQGGEMDIFEDQLPMVA